MGCLAKIRCGTPERLKLLKSQYGMRVRRGGGFLLGDPVGGSCGDRGLFTPILHMGTGEQPGSRNSMSPCTAVHSLEAMV